MKKRNKRRVRKISYIHFNANPVHNRVEDCTVRALACAMDTSWDREYVRLAAQGFDMKSMMHDNDVWGAYLLDEGFTAHGLAESILRRYTVRDFAADNPRGIFVVRTNGHVLTVRDGDYFDTWDSGDEVPLMVFERR